MRMSSMPPNLVALLRPLLDEALDLPPAELEAWLVRIRADMPALAPGLEALLAEEAALDDRGFLADGVWREAGMRGEAESVDRSDEPEHVGRTFGAYTLERPLGQGGMGTVWLARRSDGRYEGQVAVKFLTVAVFDPVGRERFRREGSTLARLTHPNIARLIDAGVAPGPSDAGRPYLVLEYVDGVRIDQYCDERRLGPAERLALFQQVLAAVAHAHASLIVHRDLKPSNILVTADGSVKLLDFGIAKLLDSESGGAERTELTEAGGAPLTPEYAAPEQVTGAPVTIATDVYALGVLLYLLLAGVHPTALAGSAPADRLRGLLETEPPRLSTAVTMTDARGGTPQRLRRLYAGDLDNIVAKALKKRPEERYATVGALADDLERYLNHQPVSARADSWGYRAAKFVRRNRVGVTAGLVILLTLVVATVFSIVQLREARNQRDAAIAESRRRIAMSDVQSVLAGDSRGAGGRTLSVLERIELAGRVLERKYRNEPAVVVEVMVDLSNRLFDMSDTKGHGQVLARALAIAQRADLPEQVALVHCLRALSYIFDEQFDSARAVLGQARAERARVTSGSRDIDVQCLNSEGQLLAATGFPDSAVGLLRQAVALSGTSGPQTLSSLNNLAVALRAAGETREATRQQQRILLELDSTGYAETDIYPAVLAFLSGAMAELGEFRAFDSIAHTYVRRLEAVHGVGVIDAQVATLYGVNKLRRGDLDSAAVWLGTAARDTAAIDLVRVGWLPPAMTQLFVEQGRIAEARQAATTLPSDSPARRFTGVFLRARIRRAGGDAAGAWTALDSALRADVKLPKPASYLVYGILTAADWQRAAGHGRAADSLARLAIAATAVDPLAASRSAHVGRAELIRARVAAAAGDRGGALQAAGRAVPALANGYGPDYPLTREARALRDSLTP
jgi:serine/threonine-protein kinase